jgi:hypothetical protein
MEKLNNLVLSGILERLQNVCFSLSPVVSDPDDAVWLDPIQLNLKDIWEIVEIAREVLVED